MTKFKSAQDGAWYWRSLQMSNFKKVPLQQRTALKLTKLGSVTFDEIDELVKLVSVMAWRNWRNSMEDKMSSINETTDTDETDETY